MDEMQKLLYEELGRTWQHFVSWREKIFGGYLTVLAALGVTYSHYDSHPCDGVVIAILLGVILFSIIFWILDVRTNQLVNACQNRAAALEEDQGAYRAIQSVKDDWPTYSRAVDVLVSFVVGGAAVYIFRIGVCILTGRMGTQSWLAAGLIIAVVLLWLVLFWFGQWVRRQRRT